VARANATVLIAGAALIPRIFLAELLVLSAGLPEMLLIGSEACLRRSLCGVFLAKGGLA
jgi:hypothetical protein